MRFFVFLIQSLVQNKQRREQYVLPKNEKAFKQGFDRRWLAKKAKEERKEKINVRCISEITVVF